MPYIVTCEHVYPYAEWAADMDTTYPVGEASDYQGAVSVMAIHQAKSYPRFDLDAYWRDPLQDEGTYIYEGPMPDVDGTVTYSIRPAAIALSSAA